ncbi:hypothetical protein CPC16_003941 [Podila verticillata]|nr:hypothetical protein CPC16_003941 [Podila verticillata]KAI9242029.1 MAG: DASH complex subunit Duo1-domain-containing protein [Podila humilis]
MSHEQYQEGSSTTPAGLRTPSRLSKRPRYTLDGAEPPFDTLLSPVANEHQDETNAEDDEHEDDEPRHDQREQFAGEKRGPSTEAGSYSSPAIQKELADVRRLVKAFDAIDRSLSETREKLKMFHKTADETNALLDMWVRVLSQAEHTQALLHDPEWEGKSWEDARVRAQEETRAHYQRALDEANRRHSINSLHNRLLAGQNKNGTSYSANSANDGNSDASPLNIETPSTAASSSTATGMGTGTVTSTGTRRLGSLYSQGGNNNSNNKSKLGTRRRVP